MTRDARAAQWRLEPMAGSAPEAVAPSEIVAPISSEAPVLRMDFTTGERFWEVLGHREGELDVSRVESGLVPVLTDHAAAVDSVVGTLAGVTLAGGRAVGVLRRHRTDRAEALFARAGRGEIAGLSVGYSILEARESGTRDGLPVIRVTRWQPREVSFVAVPADMSVGVGRQTEESEMPDGGVAVRQGREDRGASALEVARTRADQAGAGTESGAGSGAPAAGAQPGGEAGTRQGETPGQGAAPAGQPGERGATPAGGDGSTRQGEAAGQAAPQPAARAAPAEARGGEAPLAEERRRVAAIDAMAREFDLPADMAAAARQDGTPADTFRQRVLDRVRAGGEQGTGARATQIGMSAAEAQRFSVFNLVRYLMEPSAENAERAAFELEASRAAERHLGRETRGAMIPPDVTFAPGLAGGQRAQNVGTPTAGGNLVATEHLASSFIELLRDRLVLAEAGATMLTGLRGDIQIPKMTGDVTHYWVGEAEDVSDSQATFGQVTMSPKTLGVGVPITRKMMLQGSPDIEAVIRRAIVEKIARAIDGAAIIGSAAADAPDGLRDSIVGGASTWAAANDPTYPEMVELETEVAVDNADLGNLSYVYNARTSGHLRSKLQTTGAPVYAETPEGTVNGYRRLRTNLVADWEVFFGNWADLAIGMWSGVDLSADTATLAKSGGTVLRAFQDVDVAVLRTDSFHMGKNA